jgi:hypothetical protein
LGWRENEREKWWGFGVFWSGPQIVLSKMERQLKGDYGDIEVKRLLCLLAAIVFFFF